MRMQRDDLSPVLVVDDDEAIRDVVQVLLSEAEYDVHLAPDGKHALAKLCTADTPFVVVLDWHMPDMSGHDLLQRLAADSAVAQRHIYLILSGDERENLYLGAFPPCLIAGRVNKPFDIDELLAAVQAADQSLRTRDSRGAETLANLKQLGGTGTL